jgi:dihydroorotate dehydrogenase
MEKLIKVRNGFNGYIYVNIIKRIAFLFDAEFTHRFFVSFGKILESNFLTRALTRIMFDYENNKLEQNILGIKFENPVGLSAGFDKNAEIIDIISDVGFGFTEVGSVTAKYCSGNKGKRLERIKEKESLWVNLGLNNNGADEISERLRDKKFDIPIGISIAKTNCAETVNDSAGISDYIYSLRKFEKEKVGDYYVLNISCPNAYGGQPFSRPEAFEGLMKEVKKLKIKKPIFVKMSPDLTNKNVDSIIKISRKYGVKGFVCSNLTKKKEKKSGGYSGKIVEKDSDKLLRYIYSKTRGEFVLIAVGGIFSAEDAYMKIKNGANLVQLITGMIYRGPNLISDINQGIVGLLEKDGYKKIKEAVGRDA